MKRSSSCFCKELIYMVQASGSPEVFIFKEVEDREKYLEFLKKVALNFAVAIYCFALLKNEILLIISAKKGIISRFIQSLHTKYAIWYNQKYKRRGILFNGRCKILSIENEAYLMEISRYIHLRPIKEGLAERPEDYQWSSYASYIGMGGNGIIEYDRVLSEFSGTLAMKRLEYKEFVEDGIDEENFCDLPFMEGNFFKIEEVKSNTSDYDRFTNEESSQRPSESKSEELDRILEIVANEFKVKDVKIIKKSNKFYYSMLRQIGIYLARLYTDHTLKEIADAFGLKHFQSAKYAEKRIENLLKKDSSLSKRIEKMVLLIT